MNRILITLMFLVLVSSCTIPQPFDFQSERSFSITVQGAIKYPTTLTVDPYPTIEEVLRMVQLLPEADLTSINPQTILHHKDVLFIPFKKEVPCVSINSASAEDLMSLSGIGEKTAALIIEYRNSVHRFQTIEDLLLVKGIGEKTLSKFKDRLCL